MIFPVLGVIPARYNSKRFPGKPLAPILGRPMIEWVYQAAYKALSHVVVATDDRRIWAKVRGFGGNVIMTPRHCKSGTDRMYEVSKTQKAEYYVNIQGDEPLLDAPTVQRTVDLAVKKKNIATVAAPLKPKEKKDPNVVKVVLGQDRQALYFSRCLIPYESRRVKTKPRFLKHIGLYVYPRAVLSKFVRLKQPPLEKLEKLEQLRALYYGYPIYVAHTRHDSIGVDNRTDLRRVSNKLRRRR